MLAYYQVMKGVVICVISLYVLEQMKDFQGVLNFRRENYICDAGKLIDYKSEPIKMLLSTKTLINQNRIVINVISIISLSYHIFMMKIFVVNIRYLYHKIVTFTLFTKFERCSNLYIITNIIYIR